MKTTPKHQAGFTLVEIMIVVAIIGLLAAIAIPNFVKSRAMAQKNACIANLKAIDGAMNLWAIRHGLRPADACALHVWSSSVVCALDSFANCTDSTLIQAAFSTVHRQNDFF